MTANFLVDKKKKKSPWGEATASIFVMPLLAVAEPPFFFFFFYAKVNFSLRKLIK